MSRTSYRLDTSEDEGFAPRHLVLAPRPPSSIPQSPSVRRRRLHLLSFEDRSQVCKEDVFLLGLPAFFVSGRWVLLSLPYHLRFFEWQSFL